MNKYVLGTLGIFVITATWNRMSPLYIPYGLMEYSNGKMIIYRAPSLSGLWNHFLNPILE